MPGGLAVGGGRELRLGEALEDREERGAEGLREGAQERRLATACGGVVVVRSLVVNNQLAPSQEEPANAEDGAEHGASEGEGWRGTWWATEEDDGRAIDAERLALLLRAVQPKFERSTQAPESVLVEAVQAYPVQTA